jgi:hypothetical protein
MDLFTEEHQRRRSRTSILFSLACVEISTTIISANLRIFLRKIIQRYMIHSQTDSYSPITFINVHTHTFENTKQSLHNNTLPNTHTITHYQTHTHTHTHTQAHKQMHTPRLVFKLTITLRQKQSTLNTLMFVSQQNRFTRELYPTRRS